MWVRDIKIGAHVDLTDKTTLVLLRYYCTMALKADGAGVYRFTLKQLAYDAGYSVARWDEADSHRVYDALIEIMKKIESKEWDFISQLQIYLPTGWKLYTDLKEKKISGKAVFYARYTEKPTASDCICIDGHAMEGFLESCKQHPRNGDHKFALLLAVSKYCTTSFKYADLVVRGGRTSHSHLVAETSLSQSTITRLIKWFSDEKIFCYQQGFMVPNGPWDQSYFVMTNIPEVRDAFVSDYDSPGQTKRLPSFSDTYTPISYTWERDRISATS